jgi:hypothetical protein
MAEVLVARVGCVLLLLSVTACRPGDARPADDAGVASAEPDTGPSEPPPPQRTDCRWQSSDSLCQAGSLCPSVTAGFFECEGKAPIPKPGVDGQMRPRLLLVGQTYRAADFGLLAEFQGKAVQLEEVPLPWLSEDDWPSNSLVFLAGDEPALVTGADGIRLARLRAGTSELLVPRDRERRLLLDDLLPSPGGGFWFLFGESGTPPDYMADYIQGRRSLVLGHFAGGQLAPPVPLLPVRASSGARLGQAVGDGPLVSVSVRPETDAAVVVQPTLLARPGDQPLRLTGPTGVYVDSAIGLPDGVVVAMKSWADGMLTAYVAGPDGTLGRAVDLFGGSQMHQQGCMQGSDPSYYPGDDPLHCSLGAVTRCQVVGSRVETLPVMARGGRALFAAVNVTIDQDIIRGGYTQYQGDMPPRCGQFERVAADRSVAQLLLTEVGFGPDGLVVTRSAEVGLPGWRRPYRFHGRSTGSGAIIVVNDVDLPRVLAVVIGD